MTKGLRTKVFAKVNLRLRVCGKRSDGYHDLDTLFDEVDFGEELAFMPTSAGGFDLELSGAAAGLPSGDDNLVLRAARAVVAAFGLDCGGRFALLKRLPAGAGLGGGSADAAAAMRLLAAHAGLDLESAEVLDRLEAVGRTIGADVAFFVRGGRAMARGRGDEPRSLVAEPCLHYALVLPGLHCETKAVFARWHPALQEEGAALGFAHEGEAAAPSATVSDQVVLTPNGELEGVFNDLQAAAMSAYPDLADLCASLVAASGVALHLSGSGSTLFAVHGKEARIAERAELLRGALARMRAAGVDVPAAAQVVVARSLRPAERAIHSLS